MESVHEEDCQDPIPAMLTLNQAEMQGPMDPAWAVGPGQLQWAMLGSLVLPSSPELMGMSVLSCVTDSQALSSTGKSPWHLLNCGRKVKKSREVENAFAHGLLLRAARKDAQGVCVGTQSFWGPMCHLVPWEGQGQEEFYLVL